MPDLFCLHSLNMLLFEQKVKTGVFYSQEKNYKPMNSNSKESVSYQTQNRELSIVVLLFNLVLQPSTNHGLKHQ